MRHLISGRTICGLAAFLLLSVSACDDGLFEPEATGTTVTTVSPDAGAAAASKSKLPPGEASIVYTFPDATNQPEGIAFDRGGNMYVSNRVGPPGDVADNRIEKITPWGGHSILVHLGASGNCPAGSGLLGLTTDPYGNVYAAMNACSPALHGVLKVAPDGSVMHLPGSEAMIYPNALAFDKEGTLYVSDSFGGAVYRMTEGGPFEHWLTDPLLAPDFSGAIPWGANGVAFYPPNHLYVANTAFGWIAHIPVLGNGDPGIPEMIVGTGPNGYLLLYPDGLSVDTKGMLYAAIPPAGTPPPPGVPGPFPPFSPVVKVNPANGMVWAVVEPFQPGGPGSELFDTQTSLAFGNGPYDRKSLFVVSGDIFSTPTGSGPVITQVGAGVPGAMGQ